MVEAGTKDKQKGRAVVQPVDAFRPVCSSFKLFNLPAVPGLYEESTLRVPISVSCDEKKTRQEVDELITISAEIELQIGELRTHRCTTVKDDLVRREEVLKRAQEEVIDKLSFFAALDVRMYDCLVS